MKNKMKSLEANRDQMKLQIDQEPSVSKLVTEGTSASSIVPLETSKGADSGEKSRKLGAYREITSAEALQVRANMLKGKSELKLEKA